MSLVTLKHLCKEFNLDAYPLRQALRKNMKHQPNQRWKWNEDDPDLQKARAIAKQLQEKNK